VCPVHGAVAFGFVTFNEYRQEFRRHISHGIILLAFVAIVIELQQLNIEQSAKVRRWMSEANEDTAVKGLNMTVVQVAVKRGWTLAHVYNLVRAGRLPGAFKENGEWKVPQAALNDYVKRRQQRIRSSTLRREQTRVAA
jgi:helix-turn-helix protein